MINRYVFFDTTTNFPTSVATPADPTIYTDGGIYGTNRAIGIDESITTDDLYIITNWYWNGTAAAIATTNPSIVDTTTLTADGVDGCVFSGLPNPSTISIAVAAEAESISNFVEISGTFTFKTTVPGTYIVTITSDTYTSLTFTLTAS